MIEILEKLYQNVFHQKGSNSLLKRILMFSCFHSNMSCKISSNKIIIGSNKMITNTTPLRVKCQNTGLFSGPCFPAFGLNEERYSVSLRIQSECGKIWTRKKLRIWTLFTQCMCFFKISRKDTL